jgi:adenylate cyclase
VQKSENNLRITAQLIDANSGYHLWSERFDRKFAQLFALQDDIVLSVLVELQVKLIDGEHSRIASRGTRNLDAWLLRVQAMGEIFKFTRESTRRAREMMEMTLKLDPNWARPLAGIAWSYWWEAKKGWAEDREEWIRRGIAFAERAIEKDPEDTLGYMQLGNLAQLQGDHDRAIALREVALKIAPNDFQVNWGLGAVLYRAGEPERAVEILKYAEKLNPRHPASLLLTLSRAQLVAGHYEDAIETAKRVRARKPDRKSSHVHLATAYSALGRMEQARAAAAEVLRIAPDWTVTAWEVSNSEYKDSAVVERMASLLRKAGLP